jgi:hypothetical protein
MLDRFSDRTLEIATVVVVILIALVILCYAAIFINPQVVFNPFPPDTVVPTQLAQVPLAPTWTPTPTSTPTNTSTPTPTYTPSVTPSTTPTPTDTSTPTPLPPTETPTPLPPTATRPPKPRPPTATPTPYPYYYLPNPPDTARAANCDLTMIEGWVYGVNGMGEAGVMVRVGNGQGWHVDLTTDANGYYVYHFGQGAIGGKFFARVFKGGQPRSDQFWWQTSSDCHAPRSVQYVRISWEHR